MQGKSSKHKSAAPKPLPTKVVNGLFVVPRNARINGAKTSQNTTCPFCFFATAEFSLTKSGYPTIYCARCRTRVFCQSMNSEVVVRAVIRAIREVDGLADQLTAVYAQFVEPVPED